ESGWASSDSSKLLFWIPGPRRNGLWSPHTRLIIGRDQTLLSFDDFVHGANWVECYRPKSEHSRLGK
ncbi:hypothetical protein DFH09DRAFT_915981, partial [Mycena vulgaris]